MRPPTVSARLRRFRSLGHRAPLLWLVVPLLAGLSLGHAGLKLSTACVGIATFALLVLFAVSRLRKWHQAFSACFGCAALILLGTAYYGHKRHFPTDWDWLPPREAELSLRVMRTFAQQRAGKTSGIAVIEAAAPHLNELVGQRVYFSLKLPSEVPLLLRSTLIEGIGVISALPSNPSPEDFVHYLDNAGVNFRFSQGQVLRTLEPASAYRQFCAHMAERFSRTLGAGIEAKHPLRTSILRAMLLGQKSELNEEQSWLFRTSGTMHVFAISGLHIGVIATALHWLLSRLRLTCKPRLFIELTSLWLYVDITGAAPSAVRAFIMVALFLIAFALRLPGNPIATLTAASLIVLCFDPLQVFSASFQMSYGIVAALLLIGLPLAESWQAAWQPYAMLPKTTWSWHQRSLDWTRRKGLGLLGIGIAATLVSSVTGVLFFQLFTPGSLLINLWAIPLAAVAITSGFVSLLCGLIGFQFGSIVANHAALFVLSVTEFGIRYFMKLPHLWFHAFFREPWIGSATLAALLLSLLVGYYRHWTGWNRFYWAPFAVLTLGFLFGVRFY